MLPRKALYMASGGATCNVQSMDVQANVESREPWTGCQNTWVGRRKSP